MWKSNKPHIDNEKLDRFGEELLHALEASDSEINTAANSPFLYRRIRVRIEAEQRRRVEERGKWFALLTEAKHAIPVLATIAVVAAVLVWYTPAVVTQMPSAGNGSSATSQMSTIGDISPFTNDEMMASIVDWNERGSNNSKEQ